MNNINERLDSLKDEMKKAEFIKGEGISNEVNIRIFCYDPADEMAVRHFTEMLVNDYSIGFHIIEYNLYHVFLSICDDKRITDRAPDMEKSKGREFLYNHLITMASNTAFINKMLEIPHSRGDVVLITGVGEAFPFIRVHSLLEAMQPHFSDVPVLVMYPGKYDGRYVYLFDRLPPNPYYRAFNTIGG